MIAQNVAEIVRRHVKLTVEGIDRMYLNLCPGCSRNKGSFSSSGNIAGSRCRQPP